MYSYEQSNAECICINVEHVTFVSSHNSMDMQLEVPGYYKNIEYSIQLIHMSYSHSYNLSTELTFNPQTFFIYAISFVTLEISIYYFFCFAFTP
jgi:hypothetical protein